MSYADDLCIDSLSSAGLQKLLSICDEYCARVILLHLMLRNLYACSLNVLLTKTVTTQLYF